VTIAVTVHPPCLLLPVLPVILLLAFDFTAENRQSFCHQGTKALVERLAENLQVMEVAEMILGLPKFSDPNLQGWLAPAFEVFKGITGPLKSPLKNPAPSAKIG
jgi:hypothetical protein